MKKWYDEEYEFKVEVTGFLHGDHTERYCRNGEEIGDTYSCTYGCPVNKDGYGICSKTMMMLYPLMEAVRSGGDLTKVGGDEKYSKTVVCPDGCVIFRLTWRPSVATPLSSRGFHPSTTISMGAFSEIISGTPTIGRPFTRKVPLSIAALIVAACGESECTSSSHSKRLDLP